MTRWHRSWLAATVLATAVGCRVQRPGDEATIPEQPRASERSDTGAKRTNAGSSWKEAGEAAPVAAPSTSGARSHVVKKGDTMFSLARLYYNGDVHKWHAIYDANRDHIADPDQLRVGQLLVIPD